MGSAPTTKKPTTRRPTTQKATTKKIGYSAGSSVQGVFWLKKGRYTYDYAKAVAACRASGAQLASLAQLNVAYKAGMNQCNCGWTTDKKAHYPITQKKSLIWQCGGSKPGVRTCGWQKTWDAYCYRPVGYALGSQVKGVFWLHKGRYSFNYDQAVAACKAVGAQLASLAQLNNAYKGGMNQCNCGWTTDKKAHYPITQKKSLIWQCGGSKPGV